MRHLLDTKGLQGATDVLLGGCSAGGIATILHADYMRTFLDERVNVKAVPFSGFFPDTSNFEGQNWFHDVVTSVYKMQNVSGSMSTSCLAENQGRESDCFFAQNAYKYINTVPIFLVNSVYDSWTIQNIYNVTKWFPKNQLDRLVPFLNSKAKLVYNLITKTKTWQSEGNGGFLNTCVSHCYGCCNPTGWNQVEINGTTVKDAVGNWFFERSNADIKSPPPCQFSTSPPYQCNPTCQT